MIEIDGSVLEGVSSMEWIYTGFTWDYIYNRKQGGQILRIALACSVLTRTPVRVCKIRAGRKKGGLAAQHLKGKVITFYCF